MKKINNKFYWVLIFLISLFLIHTFGYAQNTEVYQAKESKIVKINKNKQLDISNWLKSSATFEIDFQQCKFISRNGCLINYFDIIEYEDIINDEGYKTVFNCTDSDSNINFKIKYIIFTTDNKEYFYFSYDLYTIVYLIK